MAIDSALGRLGIKQGVCTSSTRPTNPFEGQVIYESDTNRTLVYDNAAWVVVADNQVLSIDAANSRVGIGTVIPDVPLHIDGDAGNNEIAKFQSSQTAATYSLVGITDANETASAFVGFNPGASLNNTDSYLMLGMGGDDVNGGNGLIVKKGGSVGIGTNSPSARLDVNGETQASYVTLDRDGIALAQPAIDVEAGSMGAGDYNYFFRAWNDAGYKVVMFVNGSTRTNDGGANTMTIRNDAGNSRFGNASYLTTVEGSAVTMPSQPMVSGMWTNGGTAVASTNYKMNSLQTNVGNAFNTSTGVFTCPADGKYLMSMTGIGYANPGYGYIDFQKNGTTYGYSHWNHDTNWMTVGGTFVMTASANDTLTMYIRVVGGNSGIYANSHNMGLIAKIA